MLRMSPLLGVRRYEETTRICSMAQLYYICVPSGTIYLLLMQVGPPAALFEENLSIQQSILPCSYICVPSSAIYVFPVVLYLCSY